VGKEERRYTYIGQLKLSADVILGKYMKKREGKKRKM
jgi:hypothetical protein